MDAGELIHTIQSLRDGDAFRPRLDPSQWRILCGYLVQQQIRSGTVVIRQGEVDRSAYFLGSGGLQVYIDGAEPGSARAVMLRPGSLFGEVGLFSAGPRTAQVEAMTPCDLWALRLPRYEELVQRHPQIALEVTRAAGTVMATRMRANMLRNAAVA
jgi:CRP-like cAMP-binding protein